MFFLLLSGLIHLALLIIIIFTFSSAAYACLEAHASFSWMCYLGLAAIPYQTRHLQNWFFKTALEVISASLSSSTVSDIIFSHLSGTWLIDVCHLFFQMSQIVAATFFYCLTSEFLPWVPWVYQIQNLCFQVSIWIFHFYSCQKTFFTPAFLLRGIPQCDYSFKISGNFLMTGDGLNILQFICCP